LAGIDDLLHLDNKKLVRLAASGGWRIHGREVLRHQGIGYHIVRVAIDDRPRPAYAEERPDELGATAAAFLSRALAFFAAHGVAVRRILTDNGALSIPRLPGGRREHRSASSAHQTLLTADQRKGRGLQQELQNGWAYRRPHLSTAKRIGIDAPASFSSVPMAVLVATLL
jgi:hypothetical protein